MGTEHLERISKPYRLPSFASGKLMAVLNNTGLILGAVLLMAPFGFVPFSNTFPAVALLLYAVLFRFTGALWPSLVVTLLFAVHPLRVESVAWVTERRDVLSAIESFGRQVVPALRAAEGRGKSA